MAQPIEVLATTEVLQAAAIITHILQVVHQHAHLQEAREAREVDIAVALIGVVAPQDEMLEVDNIHFYNNITI